MSRAIDWAGWAQQYNQQRELTRSGHWPTIRRANYEMGIMLAKVYDKPRQMSPEDKEAAVQSIQWRAAEKQARGMLAAMAHMERIYPSIAQEGAGIRRALVRAYIAAKGSEDHRALGKATMRAMRAHGTLEAQAMNAAKPADWHKPLNAARWEDMCPPPDAEGVQIPPKPMLPCPAQSRQIMPVIDNGRDSRQLSVVSGQQAGLDGRQEESEEAAVQRLFEQSRAASNARLAEKWEKRAIPKAGTPPLTPPQSTGEGKSMVIELSQEDYQYVG